MSAMQRLGNSIAFSMEAALRQGGMTRLEAFRAASIALAGQACWMDTPAEIAAIRDAAVLLNVAADSLEENESNDDRQKDQPE